MTNPPLTRVAGADHLIGQLPAIFGATGWCTRLIATRFVGLGTTSPAVQPAEIFSYHDSWLGSLIGASCERESLQISGKCFSRAKFRIFKDEGSVQVRCILGNHRGDRCKYYWLDSLLAGFPRKRIALREDRLAIHLLKNLASDVIRYGALIVRFLHCYLPGSPQYTANTDTPGYGA